MEVIHCLFDTKGEVANSMLLEVNMRENNNALAHAPTLSRCLGIPTDEMNTKIIFTHNSPVRTALVNGTTGQELYRIDTTYRLVGSVTRVFRCDPRIPPAINLMPRLHWDADEPYEYYDSEEWKLLVEAKSDRRREDKEGDTGAAVAADEVVGEDSPLVENEIARLYWKWFASTRIMFEGKIRTRAEFMPLKGKLEGSYVFSHNGASYRWSSGAFRCPRLVIDDPSNTLIAQFHGGSLFKKEKAYLEVTPAGMGMLDHIVVTFIPVEVRRRDHREKPKMTWF